MFWALRSCILYFIFHRQIPMSLTKISCVRYCDSVSEKLTIGKMCEFLPLEFTSSLDWKFSSIQHFYIIFQSVVWFWFSFCCFSIQFFCELGCVVARVKRKIIGCINLSDARWWWCFPSSSIVYWPLHLSHFAAIFAGFPIFLFSSSLKLTFKFSLPPFGCLMPSSSSSSFCSLQC